MGTLRRRSDSSHATPTISSISSRPTYAAERERNHMILVYARAASARDVSAFFGASPLSDSPTGGAGPSSTSAAAGVSGTS